VRGDAIGVRLTRKQGTATSLRLARAVGREFAGSSAKALDPDMRVYLGDLVRPFGLPLREHLLDAGTGQAYADMAEELIRAAVDEDEPLDLLVLAFAMPDVQPGRFTSLHLGYVGPGDPLAFAICDQGAAAAFTALRIAREYTRSSDLSRALVLVVEQASLHYPPMIEPGGPPALPDRHTGVALLCDGAGPAEVAQIREHAAVEPESVRDLLAAEFADVTELAALSGHRDRSILVLGDGIARAETGGCAAGRVVRPPAGLPRTGIWLELARSFPEWSSDTDVIVLADYDRQLRTLCLCSFEL
jgi:hypothetical protein